MKHARKDTDQLIGELLARGYLKVSGLESANILAGLEVFDQAFFAGADRLSASLNVRLPSRVFQGSAMEMALSGDSLAKLDSTTGRKLMNFAADFLTCTCKDTPYCGCPESKSSRKLEIVLKSLILKDDLTGKLKNMGYEEQIRILQEKECGYKV